MYSQSKATMMLEHGRVEYIAKNTDVLKIFIEDNVPQLDFIGMGDAEHIIRFIYNPPDSRPEVPIAEIRFPFTVDRRLDTGEFASETFDVGLSNRQGKSLLNAVKEMNSLYSTHWVDDSDGYEDDAGANSKTQKRPSVTPSGIGELIGGFIRGFSGIQ